MRDSGHASVELAMAVGVLLLPAALAVLSFGPWLERQVLARAASAEAARAAVVELDLSAGEQVVAGITGAHGLDPGLVRLGWCGSPPSGLGTPAGSCPLSRGSLVEATVELWVPMFETPWGSVGGLWTRASHDEPVDLYRSLP